MRFGRHRFGPRSRLPPPWTTAERMGLFNVWELTESSGDDMVCLSRSLKFAQFNDPHGAPVLEAFEERQCSSSVFRLTYFVYLLSMNGRRFVSLLPANMVDPAVKTVDAITEGGAGYQPDRLTLALSSDLCMLSGAGRDSAVNFRRLTLHRHDCANRAP